eukprot:194331_1
MSQQSVENEETKDNQQESPITKQPAIFINHGGGPMPYLQHAHNKQFGQSFIIESCQKMEQYISLYKPKAICVISAHWETSKPTVLYHKSPPLYFDYYNFPPESYQFKYPAPCDLHLTDKVIQLLKRIGGYKAVELDKQRGYDHGVFIPFMIAHPQADIPLIQVSLCAVTKDKKQSARNNLRLGAILSSLRDEGVMIVGSGMSYHNMNGFMDPSSKNKSMAFNDWLIKTMSNQHVKQCVLDMIHWMDAPSAIACHPREEHLLPLHVCLGSNMDVKSMDQLFEYYDQRKQMDPDTMNDKNKMNVDVQTESGRIITFSGFTFL